MEIKVITKGTNMGNLAIKATDKTPTLTIVDSNTLLKYAKN
jgi:hypothetical protein